MGSKDLVSEEVLQELTNKIQEIVNNYCWNLEYFTPTEVEGFFDGTQQEIDYYNSLIKDDVVSKNFLHSSKQIADDIAQSILEANEYTDSLLKNISSIQLEWCETNLPTTGENNKIYILPVTSGSGSTTTVNTLNIWNNTSNDWVSIGNLEIDITQFYNKSEIDTKMDLKANKTEVVANDKIVQTLDSTTNSSDTILSTSGLQVEMDKKANDDEVIKKTAITTTIDNSSTDSEVPSALATFNLLKTVYPVGSIYINTTDVNPSTIFGFGTWERVAQNMTLWGSSADGEVGTTKSAGLPNITGKIGYFSGDRVLKGNGMGELGAFDRYNTINSSINNVSISGTADSYYFDFDASLSNSIYGNSNTVQPPALVINIWKRTA